MSTLKSNLIRKRIGDKTFNSFGEPEPELEKKVIREKSYSTNGEILLVVKDVDYCDVTLNSKTTNHIIIKALTKVIIKPSINYIDEYYKEIEINRGACVEFYLLENNWYIVSSDGLKLDS